MQPTPTTQPPDTETTEQTAPETTTEGQDDSGGILDAAGDTAEKVKDAADIARDVDIPGPVDVASGVALDQLNKAAAELAGSAFGDLAEVGIEIGDPSELVILGLTSTVHMLAAFSAFAAIATSVLFLVVVPRRKFGTRIGHLSAAVVKFLLISSLGVTIAVAAVEMSGQLTTSAIEYTLPETVEVANANVYDSALAVIIVPMVGVLFEFQKFFVGVLIAFWPLAAAVSITRAFKNALPIFTAMLAANIIWPPLAALCIGKAFDTLPSVGAATAWCIAAILCAPLANGAALAARAKL